MSFANVPSIPEFYANKTVFITGGSGFIGKILIEKLLRSCPNIKTIYLLLRPKRGHTIVERVVQITNTPLFDVLKKEDPEAIQKIVPILGDTLKPRLGLSEADRSLLINNVNIIFHTAASVRFDDYLKDAILINIRSAKEISTLALEVKQLDVLQHVSTTYCNIHEKVIEEKIYPAHGDWQEAIQLAEAKELETELEILTEKYLGHYPNTYTYTKQLAETCVSDLCAGKIPAVIFRPSVVISTLAEPFCGWIDNFNGPTGLLVAGGKGILRTVYGDRKTKTDYIPADLTTKSMIVTAWHKAVKETDKSEVAIYNGSNYKRSPINLGDLVDMGRDLYWQAPIQDKLWFPRNEMTSNWYKYYFEVILYHVFPALLVDALLLISSRKPMLLKIQRKIYIANMAVAHFMKNEWDFVNKKLMAVNKNILANDVKDFDLNLNVNIQDYFEYYKMSCNFVRCYLLKEDRIADEKTFANTKRLYIVDRIVHYTWYSAVFWFVFIRINVLGLVMESLQSYWSNL